MRNSVSRSASQLSLIIQIILTGSYYLYTTKTTQNGNGLTLIPQVSLSVGLSNRLESPTQKAP